MDLEEFREQKRLAREIQLDELCGLLDEAIEHLEDYEHLFDLQRKRTMHAQKLWQIETGNTHWPDLGKLIDWLLEKACLPVVERDRWTKVPDKGVRHVWVQAVDDTCPDDFQNLPYVIPPTWYEVNGTPVCCVCGRDLVYSHTEILTNEKS